MRSVFLPLVILLAPPVVSAQRVADSGPVAMVGTRVRVTTLLGRRFAGQLDGVTADSVRVRVALGEGRSTLAMIPRDSVARVEVGYGRGAHVGTGLLIGLGSGLVVGALLGASHCVVFCSAAERQQANAVFGAAVAGGVVLGLVVGAVSGSEEWREVPLNRVAVTMRPSGHGMGVGLAVRF